MCSDSPSYYNKAINRRINQSQLRVSFSLCPHILQLLCGNPQFRQETLSVRMLTAKWCHVSVMDGHSNEELVLKTQSGVCEKKKHDEHATCSELSYIRMFCHLRFAMLRGLSGMETITLYFMHY